MRLIEAVIYIAINVHYKPLISTYISSLWVRLGGRQGHPELGLTWTHS